MRTRKKLLNADSMRNRRIAGFAPTPYVETQGTLPPKATDIRCWIDTGTLKDRYVLPISPVRLNFMYNASQKAKRTPADVFHIEVRNIDTGEIKNFVQYAKDMPIKLWEKYEDAYINEVKGVGTPEVDEISNSVVNARLVVTPMNENGLGKNSVFILPLLNMNSIDYFMTNDYPIKSILDDKWEYFLPEPNNPAIKPKTMFIYLDNTREMVEQDHLDYQDSKWAVTTPFNNWQEINRKTFRWLINADNGYTKYNENGWRDLDADERYWIDNIMNIIKPLYQEDLVFRKISFNTPHIFKIMVPHPKNSWDSLYLYIIKGTQWQI